MIRKALIAGGPKTIGEIRASPDGGIKENDADRQGISFGGNVMNGMLVMGFGAHTDSDIAQSFSFHHEFEPTSMLCELSLSMVDENNDNAGSALWFVNPSVNSIWKFAWHERVIGSVEPLSCGWLPSLK